MNVAAYWNLPYDFVIQQIIDESGTYYHATVLDLDGCQSTGDTFQEAFEGLCEAMEGWIETKLENGLSIPLPVIESYRAKFVLQLPKSLHCRIAKEAEKEGLSLNQFALYKLAQ